MVESRPKLKPELRRYHLGGWVHTVSYRVAILYSLVTSIILVLHVADLVRWYYVKVLLLIYWIILTPLFYFVVKGTLLAVSKGVISSTLAETALDMLREKYRLRYLGLQTLFYILLLAWITSFIVFLIRG